MPELSGFRGFTFMEDIEQLKAVYNLKKESIKSRLSDFRLFYSDSVSWFYDGNKMALRAVQKNPDERIFEELAFCLLTANTSAIMGMKAVDSAREVLMKGTVADIRDSLVKAGYRYPNARAQYIFDARENLKKKYAFGIRKIIESQADAKELREFFVNEIKGLGYKEASHFLRNIGISGLAILDKHII